MLLRGFSFNYVPWKFTFLVNCLLTVLLFLFVFFKSGNIELADYFLWYLGSYIILAILFAYLMTNKVFSELEEIRRHLLVLRRPGIIVKPFTGNINVLKAEIRLLLDEWNSESREELIQMKQVETFRREFLSNVSHELKTPIFSVQGYVNTLLDGGIDDSDINMLYLTKAAKAIDRLVDMVEDLEAITKLESGELMIEKRTFDLAELVTDVFDSIELIASEKKITLSCDSKGPQYIFADKDLIRQVLVNLLVNSLKYGKKDGSTVVRLTVIDKDVLVEVEDDGIGIEKRHLSRLFERFYRVDKSRAREQGGTGLGLAIVKHILDAHGSAIVVNSVPGQGSVFTFSLPLSG